MVLGIGVGQIKFKNASEELSISNLDLIGRSAYFNYWCCIDTNIPITSGGSPICTVFYYVAVDLSNYKAGAAATISPIAIGTSNFR